MPTYEYKCNACGHRFEEFQSIKAAPTKKCPVCGKKQVERLISAGGGLIFKGSGFYITDYRDKSYNDKAKADSGAEKTETAAAPAAADAKPAAASDAKGDAKPAATPAAKSESKPESTPAKAESKPAKPEPKPQAKSSSKKR